VIEDSVPLSANDTDNADNGNTAAQAPQTTEQDLLLLAEDHANGRRGRREMEAEDSRMAAAIAEEYGGLRLWDRQPGETARAWMMFQSFRDIGPRRTFAEAIRLLRERQETADLLEPDTIHVSKRDATRKRRQIASMTQMSDYAVRYEWRRRCVAYDVYLDRERQETAVQEVRAMVQRHLGISAMLQQKSVNALKELQWETLKGNPRLLLDYLVEGTKMERAVRGDAIVTAAANANAADTATPAGGAVEGMDLQFENTKDELRRRLEAIAARKAQLRQHELEQSGVVVRQITDGSNSVRSDELPAADDDNAPRSQ
jgi:hypothetical protein